MKKLHKGDLILEMIITRENKKSLYICVCFGARVLV